MTDKNNELWKKVSKTDPTYIKQVAIGRKFHSIDPTYQNKLATELWGPMGTAWGLRNIQYQIINSIGKDGKPEPTMVMTGVLFYPGGQIETGADMRFASNNDVFKKLRTTLISKALAGLGFSADVFLGSFDDAQYAKEMSEIVDRGAVVIDKLRSAIPTASTSEKLDSYKERSKALFDSGQIFGSSYDLLMELIEARRAELLDDPSNG